MLTSFYSGLTGLSSYSNAINIVGNNLANINTTGYKTGSMNFGDLVTSTFGGVATDAAGNPMQIGLGSVPSSISSSFAQGSIQNTTEATNVAIEGNGFFIVGDADNNRYYTRDGNFKFNSDGVMINPDGKFVLGYPVNQNTGLADVGNLGKINLPANVISAPEASTFFEMNVNLDVTSPDATTPNPATYASSVTVYDSKGAPHTLTVNFTHTGQVAGNDRWAYTVEMTGATLNPAIPGGNLDFDGAGQLVGAAPTNVNIEVAAFANGADPMTVAGGTALEWRLIDANGVGAFTGYPLKSGTNSTNSNGYPPGNLASLLIDNNGVINGVFTNGQVEPRYQLAMSNFNNPKGLLKLGRNLYAETTASGLPAEGVANSGGRGAVMGAALEASNVDIATEFTNMMVFERGYQANSRVITTSDQMIQEALSLKR